MTSLWMNPAVDAAAERPAAATAGLRMAAGTPARAELVTQSIETCKRRNYIKSKLRHDSAQPCRARRGVAALLGVLGDNP